jgi:hypothetical protein
MADERSSEEVAYHVPTKVLDTSEIELVPEGLKDGRETEAEGGVT